MWVAKITSKVNNVILEITSKVNTSSGLRWLGDHRCESIPRFAHDVMLGRICPFAFAVRG